MRNLIVVFVVVVLGSCAALAQNAPAWEFFGGYSYAHVEQGLAANPNGGFTAGNPDTSGWETSLSYNFTRHWGVKADFSGHYCCGGESLHTFLFGPQWSHRTEHTTLFLHGLVGGAHADSVAVDTGAAWAAGGGFDWHVGHVWSWRVVQTDYLGTHFVGNTQNDFRLSTGVVLHWGSR